MCFADKVHGTKDTNDQSRSKKRPTVETTYERYWRLMTQELRGQVEKSARAYPFVRNVLGIHGYPKLRAMFRALPAKLAQRTAGKSVASVGGSSEEVHSILRSLQPLLEVFLAQSLRRLNDPMELMFPEVDRGSAVPTKLNALPTRNDILTCAKTISKEIASAKGDLDLGVALSRGAGNAISLFATKAEQIVVMDEQAFSFSNLVVTDSNIAQTSSDGADSSQMSTKCTVAQRHNIAVLELVLKMESLIGEVPEKTTPTSIGNRDVIMKSKLAALEVGRQRLRSVVELIIGEYLAGAAKELNKLLARIHFENFCTDKSTSDMGEDSPYLSNFEVAVGNLKREHLAILPAGYPSVQEFCILLQKRVVSMFIRHISLLRPLNQQGRLRIARDLAQFELIVSSISLSPQSKLSDIGEPYTELRAIRQILFVEPKADALATIDALNEFKDQVRKTTLWFSIFANAPAELRSPFSVSSRMEDAQLKYIQQIDEFEQNLASKQPSGLLYLNCGTCLHEPVELTTHVWETIAASLDKYMQMLSAIDTDQQPVCAQYTILENLS
mmetsp:Transcript_12030/g.25861  ORF Transcript_12030/g.25861 Transcript_12030/m.25861 type:complete len:556 (-) Transcript_12030:14-1681(-)